MVEHCLDSLIYQRCLKLSRQLESNRRLIKSAHDAVRSVSAGENKSDKAYELAHNSLALPLPGPNTPEFIELKAENRALLTIVREYEGALEDVMGKLRSQSDSIVEQRHKIEAIHQHELDQERSMTTELFDTNYQLQQNLDRMLLADAAKQQEISLMSEKIRMLEEEIIILRGLPNPPPP